MGARAIILGLLALLIPVSSGLSQFTFGNPAHTADVAHRGRLAGWWRLDEISGVRQSAWAGWRSGNESQYATSWSNNPAAVNTLGIIDKALWVTNGTALTNFSSTFSLAPHLQWSILFWVYPTTGANRSIFEVKIFSGGTVTSQSITVAAPQVRWLRRTIVGNTTITNSALVTSNWNLIAARYDGYTAKYYLTVNETTVEVQDFRLQDNAGTFGPVTMGNGDAANTQPVFIDDFYLYHRYVSDSEVGWHYAKTIGRTIGYITNATLFEASLPGGNTNEWYVATNGSLANSGLTIGSPKTIGWALSPTAPAGVDPGDTIWIRGGWYDGGSGGGGYAWTNALIGTHAAPITIRNWQNERVTLHVLTNRNAIRNNGKWTKIIGLEFTCTNHIGYNPAIGEPGNSISIRPAAIDNFGLSNVIANCVFHKMGNAVNQLGTSSGTNTIVYGNVFFYNGWQFTDDGGSGTGYSMYFRNDTIGKGGPSVIKRNLFAPGFDYAVHSYGTGNQNADMHAIQNAFWLPGNVSSNGRSHGAWISQVGGVQSNFVFGGNVFMQDWNHGDAFTPAILKHGTINTAHGPNIFSTYTNNYLWGGTVETWRAETNHIFSNNVQITKHRLAVIGGHFSPAPGVRQNVFRNVNSYFTPDAATVNKFRYRFGASEDPGVDYNMGTWQSATGYDINSTYTAGLTSFTNSWCWGNEYEANRANVFIVNTTTAGARIHNNYDVDVSSVFANGTVLNVRSAINFYQSPSHAVRTVTAGKITIPMTNLIMEAATTLSQLSGNVPFRLRDSGTNGSVAGFVLTTW